MQATTATFFAGGSGRSPLSKLSAYVLLFSMSSSVVLIGASVQKVVSVKWSRRLYVESIHVSARATDRPRRRRVDPTTIVAPGSPPRTRSATVVSLEAPIPLRAATNPAWPSYD